MSGQCYPQLLSQTIAISLSRLLTLLLYTFHPIEPTLLDLASSNWPELISTLIIAHGRKIPEPHAQDL